MKKILRKIKNKLKVIKIYLTSENQWFVTAFWRLYYKRHKRTHDNTFWLGVNTVKPTTDLWIYQEILWDKRPDVIIETGTKYGGTTGFLASICDLMGHGKIISVDIEDLPRKSHPRITYLLGSSVSKEVQTHIQRLISPNDKVMVILDSNHHYEFVKEELSLFARFVTGGQYLVLEDTSVNGNPVFEEYPDGGPMQALDEFLPSHPEFIVDRGREKFWITYNPKGFLLRN